MLPRLDDFTGEWHVARVIRHDAGPDAQFLGQARFTPDDGGLRYREEGRLILPGTPPIRAEREYLWRQDEKGIAVLFADGRAFHRIDPARPEASHWCDPDDYRVRYDFARWPFWRAEWRVSGPRKAYRMLSDYSREQPRDPG